MSMIIAFDAFMLVLGLAVFYIKIMQLNIL